MRERSGFWSRLHDAFHSPGTAVHRKVDRLVWVLVLLSLGLLAIEPWAEGDLARIVARVDVVVLILFGVELFLRVATYRPPTLDVFEHRFASTLRTHLSARFRFLLQPMQLIDLATVVAVVPALRGLRVLRLLRLLKSPRLLRYGNPFKGLIHAFESDRVLFLFGFSVLGIETILGGISFYLVERNHPLSDVDSLADGLWWALVTLTTVGYGDYSPVTDVGRFIGAFMMVGGMITLALFAGVVGHSLLNAVLSIREEQFRMSGYVNHVIVCGYEPGTSFILDALRKEVDPDETRVVLFADRERPVDVPSEFIWVQGDPRKEEEMEKVRLTHAASVIIVGSRTIDPSLADASTILTAFTMRSYMNKHPRTEHRKRPLQIVAEILEPENVAHGRASGIDEIIETRRIGFSMISHSIRFPGVGDLTGHVVAYGDHNLYTGLLSEEIGAGVFRDVAEKIREKTGVLVLGWRDPENGAEHINPSDDEQVPLGAHIIYLAEEAALPRP